jgi:hypothetical protein
MSLYSLFSPLWTLVAYDIYKLLLLQGTVLCVAQNLVSYGPQGYFKSVTVAILQVLFTCVLNLETLHRVIHNAKHKKTWQKK